jgi:hypothetical protein
MSRISTRALASLVGMLVWLGSTAVTPAATVTFDALSVSPTYTEAGIVVTATPGENVLGLPGAGSMGLGVTDPLTSPVTFTFTGGAFDAQHFTVESFLFNGPADPVATATLTGFNGAIQTGILTLTHPFLLPFAVTGGTIDASDVVTFGAGFQGITSLVFNVVSAGNQITIDNFVFQPAQAPGPGPQPVPEPTTVLLLATGCAGLLAYGWRRRQRAA